VDVDVRHDADGKLGDISGFGHTSQIDGVEGQRDVVMKICVRGVWKLEGTTRGEGVSEGLAKACYLRRLSFAIPPPSSHSSGSALWRLQKYDGTLIRCSLVQMRPSALA
jgi:hypothetical protein